MNTADRLGPVGALVRRHDPDRFLASLFAPGPARETLWLLYAFNHELARARAVASEPALAMIRLHWWREVVEGARRRHEVAGPLGVALDSGALLAADLAGLVDAREAEAGPAIATTETWLGYVRATAGALAVAAGRVLLAEAATLARLQALGTAYGIAGQLRNVTALARQGRCLLPLDLLAAHGLSDADIIAQPDGERLRPVLAALGAQGKALLGANGGRMCRTVIAAALPAVLARRDFRRLGTPAGPRGVADRVAVMAAFVAGRV